MAYQSPIFMSFTEPIIKHLKDKVDNETFSAIQKVGIEVDRDELIRALTYDRDQYEKGFRDGRMYRPPVQTNADRIRAMSDEELSGFLFEYGGSAPNCKEEIADVYITLDQMVIYNDIYEKVKQYREKKLERLRYLVFMEQYG